jgi:nucleotide-binding universal stress UspA family protein
MFRHILVPTDGSKLALKGAKAGAKLARSLDARLTGLYVVPPYRPPMYGEGSVYVGGMSVRHFKEHSQREARKALDAVAAEARRAGVRFTPKIVWGELASDGILRAARAGRCDTIVMASHGRGSLGGLILGSETQRVLAESKIPVLVVR